MESITRFLTTKLKFKVNQAKSAVAQPKDRKFLRFSFTGGKHRVGASPMLSNVVLDELDRELERQGHRYVSSVTLS